MSVLSINELSMNQANNLREMLSLCVAGELNEISLNFINSIASIHSAGLTDFMSKLSNQEIVIPATLMDRIIQTLDIQMQMPDTILQIVHEFLLEEHGQTFVRKLETLIQESKFQQSILYMMDKLHLFSTQNSTDQFFRMILRIMFDESTVINLRMLFNLSKRSQITQFIQLIADLLHLSDTVIKGKNRDMDGLELFFLIKNLTLPNENNVSNKKFIQQIHASILTVMIYKNSPHAFYDLISWHEQHPDFALLPSLQTHQNESLLLNQFLQNDCLKPYFTQQRYQTAQINQHIFLSSLADYMHTAVQSQDPNMVKILNFAQESVLVFRQKDTCNFMQWFQHNSYFKNLDPSMLTVLLNSLHTLAMTQKSRQIGRIRASAMQLVALGFSHRSVATSTTGAFIPLVNIDIATINMLNIAGIIEFIQQQTHAQQLKLLQEIVLNYVLYAQSIQSTSPTKEENLATRSTQTTKPTVPKLFRANPLERNRLFTTRSSSETRLSVCNEIAKPQYRRQ